MWDAKRSESLTRTRSRSATGTRIYAIMDRGSSGSVRRVRGRATFTRLRRWTLGKVDGKQGFHVGRNTSQDANARIRTVVHPNIDSSGMMLRHGDVRGVVPSSTSAVVASLVVRSTWKYKSMLDARTRVHVPAEGRTHVRGPRRTIRFFATPDASKRNPATGWHRSTIAAPFDPMPIPTFLSHLWIQATRHDPGGGAGWEKTVSDGQYRVGSERICERVDFQTHASIPGASPTHQGTKGTH